jgi:hypothetical protein
MATITSDPFLLGNKSFVTKMLDGGNTASITRVADAFALTQTEKEIAGSYYNATLDEIDYAEIYNLKFGSDFLGKLGASDTWMNEALTNPMYKDAFKKATGKNSSNVSFAALSETDKNWSPTAINKDANGASTTSSSGRSSGVLYYPLNRDQKSFDFLKVQAIEYVANEFGGGTGGITRDADERMGTNSIGTVFLPMQPGLAEASSVSWGDSTINALEAAAANIAGKTVGGAAEGGAAMLAGLMSGSKEAFDKIDGINADDVATYFAGEAIGKNDLMARTSGKVMNNNLELLFSGPQLRSFAYTYKFTPREEREATMVRNIIRFFKKNMSAKRDKSGSLFLESPNVFRLQYMFKEGGQHPFLNKIKLCALRSFDVQYTPDGSYMTYDDGSMTSYQVSLNFGELNPIYASDYDESTNDMGY